MQTRIARQAYAAALLVAVAGAVCAQEQPAPHASVFCIKAEPGKVQEFERFMTDSWHKVVQVRIDAKRLDGWSLNRVVAPGGEEARCTYLMVSFHRGAPPEPQNTLESDLKKAGVGMTVQEYVAWRNSHSRLVSHEEYVQYAGFGSANKGDYWQMNAMKPRPGRMREFYKFEEEVWKPLAEEAAKSGHPRKAWSGWHLLYPSGTSLPYDGVTVDTFRDWASIWRPQGFSPVAVDKVFPGKKTEELFAPLGDLRQIVRRELYVVVDTIRAGPGMRSDN